MEARLIQARKHSAKQTAGPSSFYVHKEERGGIPVSYDLYKGLSGNCLDITQEATDFLLEILGPKGAWIGWYDLTPSYPDADRDLLGDVTRYDAKDLMDLTGTF